MVYHGSWSANNGKISKSGYTDHNKKKLRSVLKFLVKNNIDHNNFGFWSIYDHNGLLIDEGTVKN